jgi:hypothetical protein
VRRPLALAALLLAFPGAAPAADPSSLRCFGAPSRNGCTNPALRTLAWPRPSDAYVWPNANCVRERDPWRTAVFDPCTFGDRRSGTTVALIGDSHATHWRGAVEVAARARGWRAVTIARPGCPFSVAIPASPSLGPGACAALHERTLAWLRAHPRVRTIFVSNWAQPAYGGGPAAFGAMLDRVPRSVRRIYVLRDIPATRVSTASCVAAVRRRGGSLVRACSVPRSPFLFFDAAAAAARGRSRVRVIDLTRFFCGATRCFPVVGGAYVYKDDNHMNAAFAATLGPYVLAAL